MFTADQIKAYLDANPQIRDSTAAWLKQQGDTRDVYSWVLADMNQNPSSVHRTQFATWQQQQASGAPATPPGSTPATPATPATGNGDYSTILTELNLDPDFASLPDNWKQEIAQIASTQGLAAAAQQMASNASATGQDPSFADARAALARWSQKANQNATTASSSTTLPLEQDILQQYLAGLLSDADHDTVRKELVAKLGEQAVADFEAARTALSPEANAARLADELAQADRTGQAVSDSAATSAADQLKALQDAITAMQGNLTGDLAAKASALADQIKSLTDNLGTLDASQKATLAQQIAESQKNLETSIASQQQNLTTEITSLRGAADTQSQSRMAALQKELDQLTAAQAPMAQARLDSANALATAVNLGLQSTQDQLTAARAKQGYLGSSTFDNAALARAGIGARQASAQALGNARELNAQDLRTIQTQGATEGRSIADELANNLLGISGTEATGTKSLADLLATGTQNLGDTSAAGNATISSNTNKGLFDVGNAGASQTYQDQVFGADQKQALADALAKGGNAIGTTLAQQQQAARDASTAARQGYFDNAYTRQLAGLLATPQLANQLTGSLTNLDSYGNTGLNTLLNTLNWWAQPTATAPTVGATAVTADNTGNQIASLGAGLLGSALTSENANNWGQKPATNANTINGIPVVNTPATASTTNWWQS